MRLLKYCRSKKVIAVVLATLIAFSTVIFGKAKTDIKSVETQKIEMTNQNRDVINVKRNMRASETITINGKSYKGRKMLVKATAYAGWQKTSTGTVAKVGRTIAVDPTVIPYGTKIYIPELNFIGVAEDCGSKIKGNRIDIFMSSEWTCKQWGIKDITIIILD